MFVVAKGMRPCVPISKVITCAWMDHEFVGLWANRVYFPFAAFAVIVLCYPREI